MTTTDPAITCGSCGHTADLIQFRNTTVCGELPHGHYQCPKCHIAWTIRRPPGWVSPHGLFIPGKPTVSTIPSAL